MFITQCDLTNLIKWFHGSPYEVMAIYLSGGTPSDNVILSNTIDNWREIDNLSRDMVCYIYFDQNDLQTGDTSIVNFISWVREYNCVDNRDYRKDADASIRITREICNRYKNQDKRILLINKKKKGFFDKMAFCRNVVGVEGFEPPASWSQTMRATKLRQTPKRYA